MGYVYKDMERLRFWCQKVLPTVYDDSLSYYELLTKVVQYLNDTVENVNTLIQQVADIDADLSNVAIIDDSVISSDYVWSSQKSNSMMNSKIIDSIRNSPAPSSTGITYSCKYITDHFSNVIEGITVNGNTVSPDAQKVVNLVVMTNAVNDLVNYYLKSETYSKVEVNTLLENIRNSSFEIVDSLPVSDIKTNVIYLVPKGSGRTGYYEWVYININGTYQWEEIGDTDIDLSGYVTTEALNTALTNYVTSSTFNALVTRVSDVEGKIPSTASSNNQMAVQSQISAINNQIGAVNSRFANYSTTEEMLVTLENYVLANVFATRMQEVYDCIRADEQLVSDTVGWSAKNLDGTKYISRTNNGITFTVNNDRSISVSEGTASANAQTPAGAGDVTSTFKANYTGQCILSGGYNENIHLYIYDVTDSARPYADSSQTTRLDTTANSYIGHDVSFYMIAGHMYNVLARVLKDTVVPANVVLYPMVRKSTILNESYEPYRDTTAFPRDEQRILGAKNIYKPVSAKTYNRSGIDWVINANGLVNANGTATALSSIALTERYGNTGEMLFLSNGNYIFNGGVTDDITLVRLGVTKNGVYYNLGDGNGDIPFTINGDDSSEGGAYLQITLQVLSDKTVNNAVFKPMIRLASDPDNTYVPYAMTNKELTDATKLNKSEVTNISANATIDAEVGNELYKQGNIVNLNIALTGVTETSYTTLFRIPDGFKPKKYVKVRINNKVFQISSAGNCICQSALSNESVELNLTWVTA